MQYREIQLDEWMQSGEGATAKSYNHKTDKSVMLKLFTGDVTSAEFANEEFAFSKNVEAMGIRTPRAIEIVKCEGKLGIIYERIVNKKSVSRLCADNPEKIPEYAKLFAQKTRALHNLAAETDKLPSRHQQLERICREENLYSKRTKEVIRRYLEKFPDTHSCLHGDLQTGNLIIANSESYWIDLGFFAYGNPMLDIACLHFLTTSAIGSLWAKSMMHMNRAQLKEFWHNFKLEYSQPALGQNPEDFEKYAKIGEILYLAYTIDLEDYKPFVKWVFCKVINIMAIRAKI